jgi:DNA-binding NtrC family response regulator
LRDRKEDIHLLFRKFASDFALKYKMPTVRLNDDAVRSLLNYPWGGNIRQLRNIAEQLSVLEQKRSIDRDILKAYLPEIGNNLPAVISEDRKKDDFSNEREILYKVLFDMKNDINDLKKLTMELMQNGDSEKVKDDNEGLIQKIYGENEEQEANQEELEDQMDVLQIPEHKNKEPRKPEPEDDPYSFAEDIEEEETLSLQDKELELIEKSLERHSGKRKAAAKDLGISERTLYRKIKYYGL